MLNSPAYTLKECWKQVTLYQQHLTLSITNQYNNHIYTNIGCLVHLKAHMCSFLVIVLVLMFQADLFLKNVVKNKSFYYSVMLDIHLQNLFKSKNHLVFLSSIQIKHIL